MDEETLQMVALELRERYPDDDDFAAAMQRLEAALAEDDAPEAEDAQGV